MTAPVTAIFGYDTRFYEKTPKLFPNKPAIFEGLAKSPALAEVTAFRNGTLQGGYFILAARSVGLDCGPMSGFDNAKVDEEFFSSGKAGAESGEDAAMWTNVKSNFLCNLGYGNTSKLYPRNPRLDFNEACKLL